MSRRVAVVGAGLSGLIAAGVAVDRGLQVTVFEKSRGTGGRMATRRTEEGLTFDHGAQYFTARDPEFRDRVATWIASGLVEEWSLRLAAWSSRGLRLLPTDESRYVAKPGMSALCRHLGVELDIALSTRVGELDRRDDSWRLSSDDGSPLGQYDAVVISTPAEQTRELLHSAGELDHLAARVGSVVLRPCWAVMLGFDATTQALDTPFDGAFVSDSPLSWVACNTSKPGRAALHGDRRTWTLHASPAWSEEHLEDSPEAVVEHLSRAFAEVLDRKTLCPSYAVAHRWRYSIAESPLDVGSIWSPATQIGICGDWCAGSRVEGAFLSGRSIGKRLADHLVA